MVIASIFLKEGLNNSELASRKFSHLWSLGFGKVSPQSLATWGQTGIIANVLLANLPQIILSFVFLTYNGLFTCMLMGKEWNDFAHRRKPLRVTLPRGTQQSTYRLQIPYRYGIPLLILSTLLHWLVSQSLFLVHVEVLDSEGIVDTRYSKTTVGYSNIAIITVICVASLAILAALMTGLRRYRPGMPIVGTSSLAISAECHRPHDDIAAAIKPVMWGEPVNQ